MNSTPAQSRALWLQFDMKKSTIYVFTVLCIILIIGPVVFYILLQGSSNISRNLSEWADFSNYWSPFISLSSLIILSYLSYIVFKFDQNRHRESEIKESILDRPILAFIKNRTTNLYYIKNVGKGAAINISLKANLIREKELWQHEAQMYSLKEGDAYSLEWIDVSTMFIAWYQDVFGNAFYSYMEYDYMTFIPESEIHMEKYKNIKIHFDKGMINE